MKKIIILLTTLITAYSTLAASEKTLPVVLIHGIWDSNKSMEPTVKLIEKHLPGTYVKNIEIGYGKFSSIANLASQAEEVRQQIENDPKLKNGCNIIGYSQGGLIARYFIQKYNNPKVYNLITWGCPHKGIYGQYKTLNEYLHCSTERLLTAVMYTSPMQSWLGIAGYWHDPLDQKTYLNCSSFLPYLNNEKEHKDAALYKKNMCELGNLVMVQSPQDTVIKPVESSQFGFYKENSTSEVEKLTDSDLYQKDPLGLKTLHKTGRLHLKTANCEHKYYPQDEENFVQNTLPYLKEQPSKN